MNFPTLKSIRERILRIDPNSKIIGGSISWLDRSCSVKSWSNGKKKRLQDSSQRRIAPRGDSFGREVRLGLFDRQLFLAEVTSESSGSDTFISDHPDVVAFEHVILKLE